MAALRATGGGTPRKAQGPLGQACSSPWLCWVLLFPTPGPGTPSLSDSHPCCRCQLTLQQRQATPSLASEWSGCLKAQLDPVIPAPHTLRSPPFQLHATSCTRLVQSGAGTFLLAGLGDLSQKFPTLGRKLTTLPPRPGDCEGDSATEAQRREPQAPSPQRPCSGTGRASFRVGCPLFSAG